MGLINLKDESLLRYYESVRTQVEADRKYKRRVTNSLAVKDYANSIREELIRRRLQHSPIEWPFDQE